MNCGVAVVLSLAVSSSTIFPMLNQREAFRRSIRASSCDIFPTLLKPVFVNRGVGLTLKVGSEMEVGVEEVASGRRACRCFAEPRVPVPGTEIFLFMRQKREFPQPFWLTIFRARI
jgi:hypothetical protein